MIDDLKVCYKCQHEFPLDMFSTTPNGKNGLAPYCRACANEQVKKHHKTKKGKAVLKKCHHKYAVSENGKAVAKKATAKYMASEKGQEHKLRNKEKMHQRYLDNKDDVYPFYTLLIKWRDFYEQMERTDFI